MLRKIGLTAALAFGVVAAPAVAEEHYVLMMGNGYFPDKIHPVVGDTIKFVNTSALPMSATAVDGTWTTGVLTPLNGVIIEVTDGMQQAFENTFVDEVTGQKNPGTGIIDYVNPPDLLTNDLTGEVNGQ
ncbi:hypothetical protein [Tropicibacter naphthalenivorans]|uniref:Plastocyanin n=1 Tax=Tropicibacter naphthalenivorans TaxID=441103 RepID=A0A0P1G0A3_9RHOB|nr:hypothetical protein [Tropicibacter naphthalenivorans]CUH75151.1 hypothetical protein TRN7648_00290 [Tropicibacter naphthalenivorans]SMC45943.1 Plastocyanin [Tropicibacter naphthalenivorans]